MNLTSLHPRRTVLFAAALLGLLGAMLVSAPAGAAPPEDFDDDGIFTSTLVVETEDQGSGVLGTQNLSAGQPGVVVCNGTNHYPHYSNGAGGAIYKVTVSCAGVGHASVSVRFVCGIYFSLSDGYYGALRASDVYTQTVTVGGSRTFHCPRTGHGNGGTGKGYWTAVSSIQIVSPALGSIDAGHTTIYKNIHS